MTAEAPVAVAGPWSLAVAAREGRQVHPPSMAGSPSCSGSQMVKWPPSLAAHRPQPTSTIELISNAGRDDTGANVEIFKTAAVGREHFRPYD